MDAGVADDGCAAATVFTVLTAALMDSLSFTAMSTETDENAALNVISLRY